MYSSQLSDTYDYEYDEEDFVDSDEKHGAQNGESSQHGSNEDKSVKISEKTNYRNSATFSERSNGQSYKTTSQLSKQDDHQSLSRPTDLAPSPFEIQGNDEDIVSLYSDHAGNTAKSYVSKTSYNESQRIEMESIDTGISGRSVPRSKNMMFGNRGKKNRPRNQNQKQQQKTQNTNVVVRRVLSASRNKTHALHNLIMELQAQVEELKVENRDLKRASRLQEKEIKRLDNEEADLPMLLQKHSSEMRVLREKLRRQKDGVEKGNEELRKKDMELLKLRDKLKKYEDIIKFKKLDERDKLNQKLEKLEEDVDDKQQKILDLEKSIRLHEKLRTREIKEKNDKYKKVMDELTRLSTEFNQVQRRLREKERELEVKNIYTRSINLKMKTGSRNDSLEVEDIHTPVSLRKNIRSSSPTDSLFFAEGFGEYQAKSPRLFGNSKKAGTTSKNNSAIEVDTLVSEQRRREAEELKEELKRKQEEIEKMEHAAKDKEVLLRREMESRLKRDKEELEVRLQKEREMHELTLKTELEKFKRSEEQTGREDNVLSSLESERIKDSSKIEAALKAEEEERKKRRQERESVEREKEEELRLENEERDRRLAEERDRRLAEERNRHLAEERDRQLAEDRKAQYTEDEEARRKKELLLARMKAIDEGKNPDLLESQKGTFSPGHSVGSNKSQKKKPIFLQSETPTENENNHSILHHAPLDFSAGGQVIRSNRGSDSRRGSIGGTSTKSYTFKTTDENMHQGLPAFYGDEGSPKPSSGRRRSQEESFDNPKTSFTSTPPALRKASSKSDRKSGTRSTNDTLTNVKTKNDVNKTDEGPVHGRRRPTTNTTDTDDPVFGTYAPTFFPKAQETKSHAQVNSSDTVDSDIGTGIKQARYGRRAAREKQDDIFGSAEGDWQSPGKRPTPDLNFSPKPVTKPSPINDTFSLKEKDDVRGRRGIKDTSNKEPFFFLDNGKLPSPKVSRPRQSLKEEINEVIDDLEDVVHL